ncbi:MAG: PAS domain S-box protein [Xanthomonadales bacterium]|nr:PAS domain S-box protein [Xanthomonadales bacterium]
MEIRESFETPDLSQVEDARGLLQTLLEAAADAIIVMDSKGMIQLFNPGAERTFKWTAEEVAGKHVSMLMPKPYRSEHDDYVRQYEKTGTARIIGVGREVRALDRDGEEFPIDLSVGEAQFNDHRLYVGIMRDLRQRTHLENMLNQERRRAERVLDMVEVVIAGIGADGEIQLVNRKGKSLFGEGQGPVGLNWVGDCVAPADRDRVGQFLDDLFRRQSTDLTSSEYTMVCGDMGAHEFAWQHQFMPAQRPEDQPILLVSGFDVTDTHRMANLLKEREERLRLLFEHAPQGIITADIHGRIESVNQSLCASLGAAGAELIGLRVLDLASVSGRESLQQSIDQVVDTGQARRQLQCPLEWAGNKLRAEVSIGLYRSPEQLEQAGLVLQIEDKTAQLTAESEVDQLRDRLAHAHRLGIMGEMAAGIAHEINQPLGAISTYSDAATRFINQDSPQLEQVRFALTQIGEQARRAGEVVRRMRAMAQQATGDREKHDVNQLVRDLVHLAELEAKHLQAPVKLKLTADLPPVPMDQIQIQQVVLNLVRNALDALATRSQAEQGVEVSTCLTEDETVRVEVADHGEGMSKERAERVFEPFFTSKPTGMGLGLSICSTIIRTHRGRLWYEPNEGGGSRFLFVLPVNEES